MTDKTPRISVEQARAMFNTDKRPPMTQVLGRPVTKLPRPLEAKVQDATVELLRMLGYVVLVTSQRRGKPPGSLTPEQRNAWYATGNSKGIADLLVGRKEWGEWFLLVEMKRDEHGTLTPEQETLHAAGMLIVAWTPEMALAEIKKAVEKRNAP